MSNVYTKPFKKIDLDKFEQEVLYQKEINKDELSKEDLVRISPQTFVYYNSCNVINGPTGSGKTWTDCKEIAKISKIIDEVHLVVIVATNTNKDDASVKTLLPLIDVPIIVISEDKAEEFSENIVKYKQFYYKILENNWENKLEESQISEVFDVLKVNDFSRKALYTIWLFNDIAKSKLFKSEFSYFNKLVGVLRHPQYIFFLNTQFWKAISTEIKSNMNVAVIFGGFSQQQFRYIFSQITCKYPFEQIYYKYRTLNTRNKMIFFKDGNVEIDLN